MPLVTERIWTPALSRKNLQGSRPSPADHSLGKRGNEEVVGRVLLRHRSSFLRITNLRPGTGADRLKRPTMHRKKFGSPDFFHHLSFSFSLSLSFSPEVSHSRPKMVKHVYCNSGELFGTTPANRWINRGGSCVSCACVCVCRERGGKWELYHPTPSPSSNLLLLLRFIMSMNLNLNPDRQKFGFCNV